MTTPAGARILVVDDEPGIARAVRMNLRRHGYDVQTAETAAAALAEYQRWRPDLLLLDLGLPDADDLRIDLEHRRVTLAGAELRLTPTEYDLLKVLATHPDRVVTDRALLQEVWGAAYALELHYLHVYIARLRKKIEADPQQPRHLITEPGVGYRFLTDADDPSPAEC